MENARVSTIVKLDMRYVFIDVKDEPIVLWTCMQRSVAQIYVRTPENTWKSSTCAYQVLHTLISIGYT